MSFAPLLMRVSSLLYRDFPDAAFRIGGYCFEFGGMFHANILTYVLFRHGAIEAETRPVGRVFFIVHRGTKNAFRLASTR